MYNLMFAVVLGLGGGTLGLLRPAGLLRLDLLRPCLLCPGACRDEPRAHRRYCRCHSCSCAISVAKHSVAVRDHQLKRLVRVAVPRSRRHEVLRGSLWEDAGTQADGQRVRRHAVVRLARVDCGKVCDQQTQRVPGGAEAEGQPQEARG